MKSAVIVHLLLLALTAPCGATEKFGRFEKAPVGAIVPRGHLREFLHRQRDGLTGHRERLGYPFNGTLWTKPIENIHFTEGVYNGADEEVSGRGDWWNSGAWWPYEQSAYQLDGMARLANLIAAQDLAKEVEENVRAVIAGATTDGDLFANLSRAKSQWPLAVFFRAADAYAQRTGDRSVYEAFRRHYLAKKDEIPKWGGRDALNLEGLFRCAEMTGDRELWRLAVTNFNSRHMVRDMMSENRVFNHGVSFCEDLKIPAIFYINTGDRKALEAARHCADKVFAHNEQASGQISANEFLSGRDPRQGFETCIAADMIWSLGYFLQASGDIRAAERMERIAYNALPGAITKDFKRHQYLSAVNQVVCTPFANNTHFNYGESAWRQYRPSHFPQCCTGNISRAMPSFVESMWMIERETGIPTALLLGPCAFVGEKDGVKYSIVEETDYPFGDEIHFRLLAAEPLSVTIKVRAPKGAEGEGTLVETTLKTGSDFILVARPKIELKRDRNWCWVERGALTFSFAVPNTATEDIPGDPFSPVSFVPAADWNYAIDAEKIDVSSLILTRRRCEYPFERPSLSIRIPVKTIKEWQVLDEQRFTPDPPLYTHVTGDAEIELVPYATTTTRITCFPDAVERVQLPVVAAYSTGEAYPYDPYKPIALQTNDVERWSVKDFTGRYKVPQRTPEIFFDLAQYYPSEKKGGKMAYLLFRVWSDEDGEATFCLGAANAYQAWIDGEEVAREEGPVEGLMMAPNWFNHSVKKGYNYVLVKVGSMTWPGQFRYEWGAKLEVWRRPTEKSE